MPLYIAAYDTERAECLDAVRKIVKAHEKHETPATFFIVAGLLDNQAAEYKALLKGHPLFEIACHSYSHAILASTPEYGEACPKDQFRHEIVDSKKRIEDVFGCEVAGFRTPVGTDTGLRDAPEVLALVHEAGYEYVSSLLWGPRWSLPAPLVRPFTYSREGYPRLWELPPCGWHESPPKASAPCEPDVPPCRHAETPEEEFNRNSKPFIDSAIAGKMPQISLVWRPWSLNVFDPGMRTLDMTFGYVKEMRLERGTFADLCRDMLRKQHLAGGRY